MATSSLPTSSQFTACNERYIKISDKQVMLLSIHVKRENLSWFNDTIYKEIIASIRKVLPLKFARDKKRGKEEKQVADVYRCANCQFAYYLKPTEVRHSVLEKDKSFISPNNPTSEESTTDDEDVKPILNVIYTGYNVFRMSLVVCVEPLGKGKDFGGVKTTADMRIDHYFGSAGE
ncbi:10106_t:CDS:2 [Paraglomus brasilianum]|uniref:10106_t:CDS:1 n=1 Tax=Paraglomus brasilianum TaxID=144538 RepID=A0A9N9GG56_9GLOM|nr:10106_t:CDS:2 [Paraglomus brasilianum]